MITHIVMWKIKKTDINTKEENLNKAKDLLNGLKNKITEIVELSAGIDTSNTDSSFDLVLYSTFKDADDLEKYRVHPDHLVVVEFMKKVVSERAVVDF